MVVQQGGGVLLYMTPQERVDMKFSEFDEPSLKYNTNTELIGNIKITGMDMYVVKLKRVGELQDVSCENFISVKNIMWKERVKLWMGKSKGLIQILWESVFMDKSKYLYTYYTLCE